MSSLAPLPDMAGLPPMDAGAVGTVTLTGRQKAAIVVQLLLSNDMKVPIADLSEEAQSALADEIANMRAIDHETLKAVVTEFADQLEAIGLSFPGGIDGALSMLDGHLSPTVTTRLRRRANTSSRADPWERLSRIDIERLLPVLEDEAVEVGAVLLSKLTVSKAAQVLSRLPGDRARRMAYAVSQTGNVDPDTVRRIGQSLATQLDAQPARAFDTGPVERVGAILNFAAAPTREDVLKGLEEEDAAFAEEVKKAIFTFTNIPERIDSRDIPKVIRNVDQPVLVTALAGAKGADEKSAEFILANMSQRMAGSLRDEMANLGKVKDKDADEAMSAVVAQIRELEAAGELFLVAGDA